MLSPPDFLSCAFGPVIFTAHVAAARRSGVEPAIVRLPRLAFDVDSAGDYDRLQQHGNSRAVGKVILK